MSESLSSIVKLNFVLIGVFSLGSLAFRVYMAPLWGILLSLILVTTIFNHKPLRQEGVFYRNVSVLLVSGLIGFVVLHLMFIFVVINL